MRAGSRRNEQASASVSGFSREEKRDLAQVWREKGKSSAFAARRKREPRRREKGRAGRSLTASARRLSHTGKRKSMEES